MVVPRVIDAHDTDYRVMSVAGKKYAFPVESLAELSLDATDSIDEIYEIKKCYFWGGFRLKKVKSKSEQRAISDSVLEILSAENLSAPTPSVKPSP